MLEVRHPFKSMLRYLQLEGPPLIDDGVLLHNPHLLRTLAVIIYGIVLLAFLNFYQNRLPPHPDPRLFLTPLVLSVIGIFVIVGIFAFGKRYYRACIILNTLGCAAICLIAASTMHGLDMNPHFILTLWLLL